MCVCITCINSPYKVLVLGNIIPKVILSHLIDMKTEAQRSSLPKITPLTKLSKGGTARILP